MLIRKLAVLGLAIGALAGCESSSPYGGEQYSDGQRAVGGAVAGALIADATDNDVLTGAAIGAAAGAYCDDLNVPGCVRRY